MRGDFRQEFVSATFIAISYNARRVTTYIRGMDCSLIHHYFQHLQLLLLSLHLRNYFHLHYKTLHYYILMNHHF